MRRLFLLLPPLLFLASTGCTLVSNAARNISHEHSLSSDESKYRRHSRRLAEESWQRCGPGYGPTAAGDFEEGYLDGYADYLYAGRTTDPWPAPPRRYIYRSFTSPDKLRAIEDYQAGFHQGASDALASGFRKQFVIPIILPTETAPTETIGYPLPTPPKPEALPRPREAIKWVKHATVDKAPVLAPRSVLARPPWQSEPSHSDKASAVYPPIQLPN